MSLPFELYEKHKTSKRCQWKKRGLKITDEEFETMYKRYIYSTHCELCNKEFKNSLDRQMEHNHETSEFRNIVCCSCNHRKIDVKISSKNTSGYKGISKYKDIRVKQGFCWRFQITINNKPKTIKTSVNFEKLKKFVEKWKKENNYHT